MLAVGCSDTAETSAPPTVAATSAVGASTTPASSSSTASPTATATSAPASTRSSTSSPTPTTSTATVDRATPAAGWPSVADVFPDDEWAIGELPAGTDRAVLDAAVEIAFGAPDSLARVRSIVVVHGGKIAYERYHPLDSVTTPMQSYSVAKSFTSAAIGLLVGDGLLDIDGPAPVDAWADPTDPRHEITTVDLLQMASGLEWTEAYGPGSDVAAMFAAPVASESVAAAPLEYEPGTTFEYSTGTTAILAGLIADTLGGAEQQLDYIHDRLLEPIGITSTELDLDNAGRWFGGFGADSTSRDFARFGLLYLHDGIWDGTRLLPEGWVEFSRTPSSANPSYGAQWWLLRPDSFEARGLFGQAVVVSPLNDLVIVVNATQGGGSDELLRAAYAELTRS